MKILSFLFILFFTKSAFSQIDSAVKNYNGSSWSLVCSCSPNKVLIGSQCIDYVPQISLSTDLFLEGAVSTINLLSLDIESRDGIFEISGNFKDFFSFAQIKMIELNSNDQVISSKILDSSFLNTNTLNLENQNKKIKLIFIGAVKFAKQDSLSVSLKDYLGNVYLKSFPITIQKDSSVPDSENRYLKYNIVAIEGDSISGNSPLSLLDHVQETKRIAQGWRVPILMSYSSRSVYCNGSKMNYFANKLNGSESNHINCLQSSLALEGETVFSFYSAYSSYSTTDSSQISAIGGQAFGLKRGVVIDYHNVKDTLMHELSHNLGLFHTFETISNPVRMKSLSEFYQIYKSTNMADNLVYKGDWYSGRLSNSGIITVNNVGLANISDDTLLDVYNAKQESLVSNISLTQASNVINFNNLTILFNPFAFTSYGQASNVLYSDFIGQSPISQTGGYVCQSNRNSSYTGYDSFCISGYSLSLNVIENTMSYWRKLPDKSFLTNGQKLRMDYFLTQTVDGRNLGEK